MKIKTNFILVIVLIAMQYSCKKNSPASKPDVVIAETDPVCDADTTKPISPFLKESAIYIKNDTDGSKLDIQLKLNVKSDNFKFSGKYMLLKSGNFKAIVVMYYNDSLPDDRDISDLPGVKININKIIENEFNWNENDTVRLMCLNEKDEVAFYGLEDFFMERLKKFGNTLQKPCVYDGFNAKWNDAHKYNTVDYSRNKMKIDKKPRLTKDDGMLTLKTFLVSSSSATPSN